MSKKSMITQVYAPYFRLTIDQKINFKQHRNSLNINYLFSTSFHDYRTGDKGTEYPKINNGLYHHYGHSHSQYPRPAKINLVVANENILGYIDPEYPMYIQILHASILKGAIEIGLHQSSTLVIGRKIRLASKKDFEDFRCCWSVHYESEKYNYKNN